MDRWMKCARCSERRSGHVASDLMRAACGYERTLFCPGLAGCLFAGATQLFAGLFLPFLRGCSMIASGPGNTRLV